MRDDFVGNTDVYSSSNGIVPNPSRRRKSKKARRNSKRSNRPKTRSKRFSGKIHKHKSGRYYKIMPNGMWRFVKKP